MVTGLLLPPCSSVSILKFSLMPGPAQEPHHQPYLRNLAKLLPGPLEAEPSSLCHPFPWQPEAIPKGEGLGVGPFLLPPRRLSEMARPIKIIWSNPLTVQTGKQDSGWATGKMELLLSETRTAVRRAGLRKEWELNFQPLSISRCRFHLKEEVARTQQGGASLLPTDASQRASLRPRPFIHTTPRLSLSLWRPCSDYSRESEGRAKMFQSQVPGNAQLSGAVGLGLSKAS